MTPRQLVVALPPDLPRPAVLARAAQLAAALGARLQAVTVIEGLEALPAGGRIAAEAEALARQRFAEVWSGLRGDAPPPPLTVRQGRPAAAISEAASAAAADLVLIGPDSHGGLLRRILGSTADRLLRSLEVPVLIVRRAAAAPYARVVAATDGSPAAEAAARLARRLAPGARLDLVTVLPDPLALDPLLTGGAYALEALERHRAEALAAARRELAPLAAELGVRRPQALAGSAAAELGRLARRRTTDLMAVGRGARGLAGLLGGTAHRLAREAACDLLVCPPP